ncbi:MAG: DUF1553 domain-containing protein [Planctomycetota bacterium]
MFRSPCFFWCLPLAIAWYLGTPHVWIQAQNPLKETLSKRETQFFESKVRPLLIDKCYRCHSLDSNLAEGGLRLDTREAMRRGGDGGPAVVPGNAEASMLVRAVGYQDSNLQMPPLDAGGKLTNPEIRILEQWVKMGAPDPREEPSHVLAEEKVAEGSDWWSYQPLHSAEPPGKSDWAWNDIDRWIERGQSQNGITPLEDAEPSTLLRRLSFDLTGLPPSVEEVRAFSELVQTRSRREAIEMTVDRLLDSEDFGPHWGRHWLDVARYGESSGRDVNIPYNFAWRYRDWVIDAFNDNMPFDRFLAAQIAGDQLPYADDSERAANLIATGFLAIGSRNLNEGNPLQFAVDQADEQIDTLFQAMMGTTFACARCHDHKFDPISQREYAALAGIFLSTDTRYGSVGGNNPRTGAPGIELPGHPSIPVIPSLWSEEQLAEKRTQLAEWKTQRDALEDEVKAARKEMASGKTSDRSKAQELRKLTTQIRDLEFQITHVDAEGHPRPWAMGVVDKPAVSERELSKQARAANAKASKDKPANAAARRPTFATIGDSPFFARGEIGMPGERIPRSVPKFCGSPSPSPISQQASGRLELAQWVIGRDNPLTARVAANRVWYWLMGQGIVETVDNFGTTGSEPTHPELLDHLAIELRDRGWDIKALIRKIVTSRAYQLSSVQFSSVVGESGTDRIAENAQDPDNRFYWRGKRRRLQAEEMRDSMLFLAGRLDRSRPVATTMAKNFGTKINVGIGRKRAKGEVLADDVCRSVYLSLPRSASPEVLELFDLPDGSFVQGVRESTNVPSQSLFMLNSPQVAGHAAAMVRTVTERIPGRGTKIFEPRATMLWQMLLARNPAQDELEWARNLWTAADNSDSAWVGIVRGLLATAEYRYLD